MNVGDIVVVGVEVTVVVDQVWVVVQLGWQALTVEKSELMVLQLGLGRVSVHRFMLTLHGAQLSGCVVTVSDFTDLVADLVFILNFRILLVFVAFS